ncbi:guanylate cyclase beta-like isoform X2 [Maniola hyperantus]|uniref:guanylate cyclase beta-like isoform X2 n=1 Tax=Aphantopus hyperantus TaxID=2795564 RepID=UPI003748E328
MLALLLLLHHATARDTPQGAPIIKHIASCPDVGYYFNRESNLNSIEPGCHLCFCQGDGSAVCWPRESSRCDDKHYRHYGRKKRLSRVRRSPGFTDIFFSDAAKDVDWCIGCTVCDCNANGRWDCHVLSFCDDAKGKKKMKKKRGKVGKRQAKMPSTTMTTKKPTSKTTKKQNNPLRKSNKQRVTTNQRIQNNLPAKSQSKPNKSKPQKVISVKKTKVPVYKKKSIPKNKEQPNSKIIRKSKNPSTIQIVKRNTKTLNEHEEMVKNLTHTIFKKVMNSVEKIIRESQKNITHTLQQKIIQERSMPIHYNNETSKKNNKQKPNFKKIKKESKGLQNNQNLKSNGGRRSKRAAIISSIYISQEGNITNATDTNVTENIFVYNTSDNDHKILNKPNYFKYTVFDIVTLTGNKNSNQTHIQRYSIPNEAKNTTSEVTSNAGGLKMNASKENFHAIDKDKLKIGATVQAENNFTKDFMNISKLLFTNGASIGNMTNNFHNFTLKNNIACGKICKFKKIFKKFVGFGNANTTTPVKNKIKKKNILKYLKTMFRKVFIKKKVKNKNTIKQPNRKHNLITTICQNFGSCTVDLKNKKLTYKIDQLRAESIKIMQSVNIIKGLLQLLDVDGKKMKNNSICINKQICNDDIDKLNAIIKCNYEKFNLDNLTETASIQISYIKQNIEIFMQSMEKFAHILNDVVQILIHSKTHYSKVSNHLYRNPKKQGISKSIKNNSIEEKLGKIKEVLTSYNLVQNQFMKRMYDVIKTLGPKTNQETTNNKINNENKKINNAVTIEIYTQNIIKNLRKLNDLAHKLSFKNRRKRETMDDNGVLEYLLILMEYLLKQQNQLKISPASDGIDLLIDAIKSAPNIKATRKKVLDHIPLTMEIETTEAASIILNTNEIADETNGTSNSNTVKFKTFESIDEDEESSDLYQYNKKFHKKNKKGKFETEEIKEDIIYTLTTPSYNINSADDEKTSAVMDKTDTKKTDDGKEFEVFIDDANDDDGTIMTTTKSPVVEVVESETARYNKPMRTYPFHKLRDEQSIHKDSNDTYISQYNRIKLNWIEDSYNQEDERKELPRFIETTTQKQSPTHTILAADVTITTTRKKEKKADKYDDPLSSISRESEDEDRKRTKNLNPEYVMYKKQMNLLNSLDYGTEKIEIEEDSTEEKSNVEQFHPYFV